MQLFAYDNDAFILRSDLPYNESVTLEFAEGVKKVTELKSGRELKMDSNRKISMPLMSCSNFGFRVEM